MSYYQNQGQPAQYGQAPNAAAQNLQFFPSSYTQQPGQAAGSPFQTYNGMGGASTVQAGAYGFGDQAGAAGVSGRMGEQGGLRTGWLAVFGTEGYEGEPPLLEELGVNFGHIKVKVCL